MMGSFVTRSLALILGYAYPAYECFKTVELNKPDIEQLLFWCQYWILVAVLTVLERVGDNFISWLPMYGEAKLLFFVYLWCPKTKGTAYVYETFLRPYVAKHEIEIDRNLLELRTRAGDCAILYFQKVASYGQTRFFEILQYVASQSPSQSSRARPVQPPQKVPPPQQQPEQRIRRTISASAARELAEQVKQPKGGPSSPTRSQQFKDPVKAAGGPASSEISSSSSSTTQPPPVAEKEVQVAMGNGTDKEAPKEEDPNSPPPPDEETPTPTPTPIEEAIRVTRARIRKRAAIAGPSAR